jgi:hypothetical protein
MEMAWQDREAVLRLLVDHRCLDRGDRLGTHPGGRFGHVPAQLGPLI